MTTNHAVRLDGGWDETKSSGSPDTNGSTILLSRDAMNTFEGGTGSNISILQIGQARAYVQDIGVTHPP